MDFITHTLAGVSLGRVLVRDQRKVRVLCLAAALGSLLPDCDVWLYFIGPEAFGRWHRVVPNSLIGSTGLILIAATLAWWIGRSHWFHHLPLGWIPGAGRGVDACSARWGECSAFAALGVGVHLLLDWITGWGVYPAWPWSTRDFSLRAVNSFDWAIFSATLFLWGALHIVYRDDSQYKPRIAVSSMAVSVLYIISMIAYLYWRVFIGTSTYW